MNPMEVFSGRFDDIPVDMSEVYECVHSDLNTKDDVIDYLKTIPIYLVFDKDVFCGFFTLDYDNPRLEGHIFLLPNKRYLSVKLIRYLTKMTLEKGLIPYTTVSGDYPHIKRCLELLGYKVVKVDKDKVIKKGKQYDFFHLEYKE